MRIKTYKGEKHASTSRDIGYTAQYMMIVHWTYQTSECCAFCIETSCAAGAPLRMTMVNGGHTEWW